MVFFFYMDQNVSSLLTQQPYMRLQKGFYYHSSFLIIGVLNMLAPLFGCVCVCVCVCACVCARARACVCVCVSHYFALTVALLGLHTVRAPQRIFRTTSSW